MARPPKLGTLETSVSIFEGAEGWQGWITVGKRPDGKDDRRHRRGKSEKDVARKLLVLQTEMAAGNVTKVGVKPLLADWLRYWLANPDTKRRYNTQNGSYAWAVNKWLIPGLGAWRLDQLEAGTIETFLKSIYRDDTDEPVNISDDTDDPEVKGLSDNSVHAVFRILRAALNTAVRHKEIPRNPMDFMNWRPSLSEEEVTPLFVEEVKAVLDVCTRRRNGTRWSIGMPLGLRQGEALGLPWMKPSTSTRDKPMGLDLTGWLIVRRKAERRKWQHGCKDPAECARARCRTTPCPPRWQHGCGKDPADCTKHRVDRCPKRRQRPGCADHRDPQTCRKVCPPDCTDHAQSCPKKKGGGIVFTDTKSEAGRRRMALAPPMVRMAVAHQKEQDRERELAGDTWTEHGLVWCQPNGNPIDARTDWLDWKDVLREAGVRDARVHDGRHTAATMLLLQGIDEQTVMAVMGWSDRRMLRRYQHVIDELRVEASKRIGALLWGDEPEPETDKKTKKDKKGKKKTSKKKDQAKLMGVDEGPVGVEVVSDTDLDTGEGLAKIIPFRRPA